jgi:hypothetical protein
VKGDSNYITEKKSKEKRMVRQKRSDLTVALKLFGRILKN